MLLTFVLALLVSLPTAERLPDPPMTSLSDTLAALYARNDTAGLVRLYGEVREPGDVLLARYRLYPLTQDARYIRDLPDENACRTARDYALLGALWAYRAAAAPPWKVPVYGLRSEALLDQGRALDPRDPFVLLVSAQSLLYRPGIFGGSTEAALAEFEKLRAVLREHPTPAMSSFEPEVWIWYSLRKLDRPHTEHIRDRLLAQDPPPLFRQFLIDPP